MAETIRFWLSNHNQVTQFYCKKRKKYIWTNFFRTEVHKQAALKYLASFIAIQIGISFANMLELMNQCQKLEVTSNVDGNFLGPNHNPQELNAKEYTSLLSGVFPGGALYPSLLGFLSLNLVVCQILIFFFFIFKLFRNKMVRSWRSCRYLLRSGTR